MLFSRYAGSAGSAVRFSTRAELRSGAARVSRVMATSASDEVSRPCPALLCPAPLTSRFLRPHRREQNYVPNGRLICDHHHQAVDADAQPTSRRHAVFECTDVVGVVTVGIIVAGRPLTHLVLEAAALIIRVVQLAKGIGQLAP